VTAAAPTTSMTDVPPPPGAGEPVLCPLCDYDLRGLTEPRCPECGYRFAWDELRDSARRLHRYLFEHHPERNVWSLVRTFVGTMRPRRFWAELHPAQPSRPKRLVLYWLVLAAVCMVPHAAYFGWMMAWVDNDSRTNRAIASGTWWNEWPSGTRAWYIREYGSKEAALDATMPTLPSPRVALLAWRWGRWPWALPAMVTLLWPWLTVGALMVFRASMRRAKVRAVHVLRCVIYSADACVVAAVLLAALGVYTRWGGSISQRERTALRLTVVIVLGLMVFLTRRLYVACWNYLRFDHALATVLASQAMVWLLLLKLALDLDFFR